jgi:hypothetical protein
MPTDDGLGLHNREHVCPPRPHAGQDDSKGTIDGKKLRTLRLSTEDRELLAQREVLHDEAGPRPEGGADSAQDRHQQFEHDRTFVRVLDAVTGESAPSVR